MTAVDTPSLFDVAPEPFRNVDPPTARIAAEVLDASNDRALVLEALIAIGGRGTADDVWDHLDRVQPAKRWQRSAVSSRLSQLKDPRRFPEGTPVVDTGEVAQSHAKRPVIVFEVASRG